MNFLRALLLPLLSILLVTENQALRKCYSSYLGASSIGKSSEKKDARVGNHTKQGGATKVPGSTVKLPISYTRSQKVFGKNVKNIVTRQRNNGKGRAYNIEFEDGTKIDINPDRVKIQVIEPKNPRGGIANHNFAKKGGLPEGTKVLGTSGNNRYKRTLTQAEVKLLEDLKELIKNE